MLEEANEHLVAAKKAFAREQREEQAALLKRDRAEEALRRAYVGVTNNFVGDAQLAGLFEIAERLRPTANRRKGVPEEVDREIDLEEDGDAARERELVGSDES